MAALPRGMAHIDRRSLYTSLPARINYLKSVLEFGPDDIQTLIQAQPYFAPLLPQIVDLVYRKLLQSDITARVFRNRDSRSEVDPEFWPQEDSNAITARKMFLRWYFSRLMSLPSEEEEWGEDGGKGKGGKGGMGFWEYLDMVGAMHTAHHRRQPLYIDYIHLNAILGYISTSITDAILSSPLIPSQQKAPIIRAITKLLWIQNDLLSRWHIYEGEEYRDPPASESSSPVVMGRPDLTSRPSSLDERSIRSSSSGKTSLGRKWEDVERAAGASSSPAMCPFSGVLLDEQRAQQPVVPASRRPDSGSSGSRRPESGGSRRTGGSQGSGYQSLRLKPVTGIGRTLFGK